MGGYFWLEKGCLSRLPKLHKEYTKKKQMVGRGVGGDDQATAINPVTSLHARNTRRANTLYTAILAPWWKLYLFRHLDV